MIIMILVILNNGNMINEGSGNGVVLGLGGR